MTMSGDGWRMSHAEFKVVAAEVIQMCGREAFDDLPLWMQITTLAALKANNEEDLAIELRKSFYLFGETERMMIVKAAFEDASELSAPLRRLIRELPRTLQLQVLQSVETTERR
jgi:hypothetical protein